MSAGKGGGGKGKGRSGRALRGETRRLTDGKSRKASSRRWLERQLADPYVRRAKAEGYASRAAFKLAEIDDRHSILRPGTPVVDLGAAPGGWSQVAAQRTASPAELPHVVGIDLLDMAPIAGVVLLKGDFLDAGAPARLVAALGGSRPGVVLSDMAAATTGHRRTDHLRTMALAEAALDFATATLIPGGHFLCKTFQGGTGGELLARMKRAFATVHHVKPPSSRGESVELYLLAKGFRGGSGGAAA
jgi:23S rRNA (uridine2552-2'-O)-methyltransferase